MRIRRKKNIDSRTQALFNEIIKVDTSIKNVTEANKNKAYIDVEKIFQREGALYIEIGCGKGGFIKKLSQIHPENNYIAIEMIQNVIIMAGEAVRNANISNVKFLNIGAEYLPRYIKDESVSGIYLNFSPPFPQKSYECRRLTNADFVERYLTVLKNGGFIEQKTDDRDFFEYSFEMFKKCGLKVENLTENLANDSENIITEYESKFLQQGLPIYKLRAIKE